MPLINYEVNLILTWSSTCVLIATNIPNQNATFAVTDTKLFVLAFENDDHRTSDER